MQNYGCKGPHDRPIYQEEVFEVPRELADETESRVETSFRENASTSGNVSEQVNAQILSSLIETENHNQRCLRALEERIHMLEVSGHVRPQVRRQQYEISTDSLQEES